jgi:hypothetical protein
MNVSRAGLLVILSLSPAIALGSPPAKAPACRAAVIEGELKAGQSFSSPFGNGLRLWFQPIASGWILRVVPVSGLAGDHDYAELATPPYRSVSPLSLSTDFAFRAQDAVGWNPRRFRYAASAAAFARLDEAYRRFMDAGAEPPAPLQTELSDQIARSAGGKLTILDARLEPGGADQSRMAAAVSSRFDETAHQLERPSDGKLTPLGKLIWVRFRVELDLPQGFAVDRGLRVVPHACGNL